MVKASAPLVGWMCTKLLAEPREVSVDIDNTPIIFLYHGTSAIAYTLRLCFRHWEVCELHYYDSLQMNHTERGRFGESEETAD